MELLNFHKDIIRIHKEHEALRTGSLKFLHKEYRCIAYGRFSKNEAVAIVINNDYVDKEIRLHVRELGVYNNRTMKRVMITSETDYSCDDNMYIVQNNVMTVIVPKMSASIYVCKLY